MNLRSNSGFSGADMVVAFVGIFMFTAVIAALVYGYNNSVKELELKSEATYYAVQVIEEIKIAKYSEYLGILNENIAEREPILESSEETGFYKTINILDYSEHENAPTNVEEDKMKIVTVTIEYRFEGDTEQISVSTPISCNK